MRSVFARAHEKTIAVVDVESGSVGVAIVAQGAGGARVISHARISSGESARDGMQIVALKTALHTALAQALDLVSKESARPVIEEARIVLHAPLMQSVITRASRQFDGEIRVDETLVGEIAKEAYASQKGILPDRLVDAYAYRVELNGYETKSPGGKYAHDVGVTAILSECDPLLKEALRAELHAIFPAAWLFWRSGMRTLLSVLHAIEPRTDFVAAGVGSYDAHMIVSSDGDISQCSVAEGGKTVLSKIAAGNTAEETLAFMRMIANDSCEGEKCAAVQKNLALVEPDLSRVFGESLGQLSLTRKLPDSLVVISDPQMADFFTRLFSRIDFTQFTATTLPFTVRSISSTDLSAWISVPEGVDTSLVVACALVNIESASEA